MNEITSYTSAREKASAITSISAELAIARKTLAVSHIPDPFLADFPNDETPADAVARLERELAAAEAMPVWQAVDPMNRVD